MEQRLENSTLIALRELRGYEKERQLAERRKQEENARQARERKERERQAEEAARERALENQLRTDLQRAEEEIRLLRQEADLRMREATHAMQALASVPQAPSSPAPAPPTRHGNWLAASGCTALLASTLVLLIGLRRDASIPAENSQRNPSFMEAVAPTLSPKTVTTEPATAIATARSTASGLSESGKQRPPTPHPRSPGAPHALRKPNPPKPTCDGSDPLCGLNINSLAPR